jgi:preprotein translocase subunit SecD
MRRTLLIAMMLAGGVVLGGCAQSTHALGPADQVAGAAPLPHVRLLMREVDEQAAPSSTLVKDRDGAPLALREPPFISTADVASVAVAEDYEGQPVLNLKMTEAAAPRILAATQARIGRRVAFTVGDRVMTVATIRGTFGEAMQVSGLDGAADAQRIYTEITGRTQ